MKNKELLISNLLYCVSYATWYFKSYTTKRFSEFNKNEIIKNYVKSLTSSKEKAKKKKLSKTSLVKLLVFYSS